MVDECTGALVELCCTCEDDVATRRLLERHERGQDFSEATDDVRRLLAARMDPWPTAELIDTTEGATARYLAVALELVGQERA